MITNLFIKNLQLQNYKSIRNLDVRFNKGLNIIIGENGAGKTNLLEFMFKCFSEEWDANGRMVRHGVGASVAYRYDISYSENGKTIIEKVEKPITIGILNKRVTGGIKNTTPYEEYPVLQFLWEKQNEKLEKAENKRGTAIGKLGLDSSFLMINFNDPPILEYISKPKQLVYDKNYGIASESMGSSLSLLEFEIDLKIEFGKDDATTQPHEKIKKRLSKVFASFLKEKDLITVLKKFTPIEDLKLNESINIYSQNEKLIIDNIQINFKINDQWLPWSSLSDGTRRIFYIILETLEPLNKILLMEEPELGIHPNQLYKLMNFLKEMAEEKQIIITTHSPIALDVLSPEELDAIIIAKYTPKGTEMNHLTPAEIRKAKIFIKNEANLSGYWLHSDLEK